MSDKYRLDGETISPVEDLFEWARWFETADRRVRVTELPTGHVVSTVFLGIDHNHSRRGPPVLFETMTAGDGEWLDVQARCCTYAQAVAQHERIVMEQTERLGALHKHFKEWRR